jgi:acyl carrier protein
MQREAILSTIITIIAETYGLEPEELSAASSLIEDVDLKGNIDEFGRFVQRLNHEFDIEMRLSDFQTAVDDEDDEGLVTISDIAVMVEDAMLG